MALTDFRFRVLQIHLVTHSHNQAISPLAIRPNPPSLCRLSRSQIVERVLYVAKKSDGSNPGEVSGQAGSASELLSSLSDIGPFCRPVTVTIGRLPDDVLLEIFDFYVILPRKLLDR